MARANRLVEPVRFSARQTSTKPCATWKPQSSRCRLQAPRDIRQNPQLRGLSHRCLRVARRAIRAASLCETSESSASHSVAIAHLKRSSISAAVAARCALSQSTQSPFSGRLSASTSSTSTLQPSARSFPATRAAYSLPNTSLSNQIINTHFTNNAKYTPSSTLNTPTIITIIPNLTNTSTFNSTYIQQINLTKLTTTSYNQYKNLPTKKLNSHISHISPFNVTNQIHL